MGSYANSLHVRADRSEHVVAAIHDLLGEQEWQPTDELPDEEAPLGIPSLRRALVISAPSGGWVSILDSDLMGIHELGPQLAERLGTTAIFFLVNDSDGWSYLLAEASGKTSAFDTLDEDGANGDDADDLAGLGEKLANVEALMSDGSFQERMAQMQQQMMASAPPEIQECEARMRSGAATPADMQRYQAWAMQEMPKFQGQLSEMLGGLLNFAGQPSGGESKKSKVKAKTTRQQKTAQRKRLEKLRPLLVAGVDDEQVQAALDQRAVFAEETLANFLPLLGIPAHYAYLDYHHLRDTTPEELAAEKIRFVHELKFERSAVS